MNLRFPPWMKIVGRHGYRSFREFGFLVIFAFMPVWLGAVLRFLQSHSVANYLNAYLADGQALLLCTATIGPLLFTIISSDSKISSNKSQFPLKEFYVLIISVVCIISAAVLGFKTAIDKSGALAADAVWALSALLCLTSLGIWFGVVGTNAARQDGASEIMSQETRDFVVDFGRVDDESA